MSFYLKWNITETIHIKKELYVKSIISKHRWDGSEQPRSVEFEQT